METTISVLALATALVVLVTAVITLVLTFRNRKRVQEIHVMVNQQNDDLNERIDQLTSALVAGGVGIPPRQDLGQGKDRE